MARPKKVPEAKVYVSDDAWLNALPKATEQVKADAALADVLRDAASNRVYHQKRVDDFSKKLVERDATYAFEWSADVFKSAGELRMADTVLAYHENMTKDKDEYDMPSSLRILKVMFYEFHREMVNGARWPSHSTSVPSNEMSLCLNAARAEWVIRLGRALYRITKNPTFDVGC